MDRQGLLNRVWPKIRSALPARHREWLDAIDRVKALYKRELGREPSIFRPYRFTEKMQWRKLFDLDPLYAVFSDKYETHRYVSKHLGPQFLPKVYFVGDDADTVPIESLPRPCVVKSTHAFQHVAVLKSDAPVDAAALRDTMRWWLKVNHGRHLEEPGYVNLKPRIIVEEFLGDTEGRPFPERKIFVFDGKARFVESIMVLGDERERRTQMHTADWTRLYWRTMREPYSEFIARPARLDDMIATAERLAAGRDFLRVDFYDGGDRYWVGEITVYSWSGMVQYTPDEVDHVLGAAWHLRAKLPRAIFTMLFRRREILPPATATELIASPVAVPVAEPDAIPAN